MSELTTGGINFGYQSPINLINNELDYKIKMDFERNICEAIQKCEIVVDKPELIKALQYDRNQYDKGYSDGRASKEPVFFPPCVDCNKKMDEVRRAYDNVQAGKNDIVEELENIKAEIKKTICNRCYLGKIDNCLEEITYCDIVESIKIIDNHIKELKGENNAE